MMKTSKVAFLTTILLLHLRYFAYAVSSSDFLWKPRIVNGRDAKIENFPYQISLRRHSRHVCGAAVLSTEWAISAAHCIEDEPHAYSLRVGSNKRSSGGFVIAVSKIQKHPKYSEDTANFDVALIQTEPNKLRGSDIAPIKLPKVAEPLSDNTEAIVSGWGDLRSGENALSSDLKYTIVYVINQKKCENDLMGEGEVTDAMFCAGARNTDACQGDSGGPLQINGTLVGVVSWGVGCADPHYPGVYTRLAYPAIRLWIKLYTKL